MKFLSWKRIVLISLVILGFIAGWAGIIDWNRILLLAQATAGEWWAPPAVVAIIVFFYLLALPGSMFFWIAGLLYEPVRATIIVTVGGVAGALLAYLFARRLAGLPESILRSNSPFFRFMERNTDLATLCAIRIFPFFPHSVINYGAGILGISIVKFAVASILGYAFKGYIYSSAVRGASTARNPSELVDAAVMLPLLALAALFLIGSILRRHWLLRD